MAGITSILHALKRGTTSVDQRVEATGRGASFTQKDLPDYTELVRSGVVWTVGEATAVAAVTAPPTTTAGISLYNDEAEGSGLAYVLLKVFGLQVGASAALASWGISHNIATIKPTTKPTGDIAASSIKNLRSPSPNYGGKAIVDLAATVTDDLWKPIGNSTGTVVVSLTGTQIDVLINGMVVVMPGGMYSLKGVASDTGITVRLGFVWAEVKLD